MYTTTVHQKSLRANRYQHVYIHTDVGLLICDETQCWIWLDTNRQQNVWVSWDWSLILRTCLPSVLWHCWLGHLTRKTVPDVTYNVFGGTLSLTQSINQSVSLQRESQEIAGTELTTRQNKWPQWLIDWLYGMGLTSHQTHYRSYRGRVTSVPHSQSVYASVIFTH